MNRPHKQAGHGGLALSLETVPMLITAPEDGWGCRASMGATEPRGKANMLLRRLCIRTFTKVMLAPQPPPRILSCPLCFALLVAASAARCQARSYAWKVPGLSRLGCLWAIACTVLCGRGIR